MKRDLNTIKNWFKKGLKPKQEHYHDWMDSFWHKDEKINCDSIACFEEITQLIASKAPSEALQSYDVRMDAIESKNQQILETLPDLEQLTNKIDQLEKSNESMVNIIEQLRVELTDLKNRIETLENR